ncbi:hypothetical protein DFJ73DRAFT_827310 [Zopfochytrium polystomum]|nr:hypothetical protein DFJ73DRAFT_827310 [Zopfochytrium polystomum]
MAEMGGEEEESSPSLDSSLSEGGGTSEQDDAIDYYALIRIPDPRNMTLVQLGTLLESRIADRREVYEAERTNITRYMLCCFFKHAIRYFNQEEGNTIKYYIESWEDSQIRLEQREKALGDRFVTLFEQGDILLFQSVNDPAVHYQVTLLRSIQLYATGEGQLVPIRSNDAETNYRLEEIRVTPNGYAPTHSCALTKGGFSIAVFDHCWNPTPFVREIAVYPGFMAVTPGPHENVVTDAVKSLKILLEGVHSWRYRNMGAS